MGEKNPTIAAFISRQANAVAETMEAVVSQIQRIPRFGGPGELQLVGSGTSFNALLATEAALGAAAGLAVRTLTPIAFLKQDPNLRRLSAVMVLSHSGTSATSVAAAQTGIDLGIPTIVVTGYADSALAVLPAMRVILPISDETVGAKTKGYTASLLALLMIARHIRGKDAAEAPELAGFVADYRRLIVAAEGWAESFAASLDDADAIAVMGQGRHLATALEGALKIAEIAGIPTLPSETEDACHGRFFGYTKRTQSLFIAHTAEEKQLAATAAAALTEFGLKAAIADLSGASGQSPHDIALPWPKAATIYELDLLSAVVPFQWLAQRMALRRGRVPEVMPYPGLSKRLGLRLVSGAAA